MFYNMTDVTGLASHIIYKEHNPRFKTKNQWRKLLKHLAKELCMPLDWSTQYQPSCDEKAFPLKCSRNSVWTTDCVIKRAAATSSLHRGSHASTPIVGSCYFCRDQNRKKRKIRKSCVSCMQPACNEDSVRQHALFVKITESSKEEEGNCSGVHAALLQRTFSIKENVMIYYLWKSLIFERKT